MPWSRAKALPPPYLGIELFNAQFRIQREASEAAGRHIPMVVENVRGAQKWVGRARWHYGSFFLWGDVPALMPMTFKAVKVGGTNLSKVGFNVACVRKMLHGNPNMTCEDGRKSFQTASVDHTKTAQDDDGGYGGGFGWDNTPMRRGNSKSNSRKAASAMIAKIPFPLASHIARCYYPAEREHDG